LVIPLEKSPAKTSMSANHLFFLILHISFVIPLVNTDRMCPSVYTSGMTNVKYSVGIKRIFGSVRVLSACGQLDCLEFGQ
jgi:hypothetical protein